MRRAREARKGMSGRVLGAQIGCSHVLISYWETGKTVPDEMQLVAFMAALGVVDGERDQLLTLAKNATDPNWLAPGINEHLSSVMEYERTASDLTSWEPLQVPGLLQTSEYARAVLSSSRKTAAELETAVIMRVGRGEILTRRNPLRGTFVIGEAALHQPLGGAEVMAHQLRRLVDLGDLPNITVRLLPFGEHWHPGLNGAFVLYRFADQSPIVYLENFRSAGFPYEARDVEDYVSAADTILGMALSADDTRHRLEQEAADRENNT